MAGHCLAVSIIVNTALKFKIKWKKTSREIWSTRHLMELRPVQIEESVKWNQKHFFLSEFFFFFSKQQPRDDIKKAWNHSLPLPMFSRKPSVLETVLLKWSHAQTTSPDENPFGIMSGNDFITWTFQLLTALTHEHGLLVALHPHPASLLWRCNRCTVFLIRSVAQPEPEGCFSSVRPHPVIVEQT